MHATRKNDVKNALIALAASALAALAPAGVAEAQRAPNIVLESSVETTTDAVIFPSAPDGRITVRNCGWCEHPTMQLAADTQYILAGQYVSMLEMAKYCRGAAGKALTVSWRLKDHIVSRVSVLEK
jgi:hypothetical protein